MHKLFEGLYRPVRTSEIISLKTECLSKFIMSFWNKWLKFCFVGSTCTINEVIDLNLEGFVNKLYYLSYSQALN